jgi:hypothetical protein
LSSTIPTPSSTAPPLRRPCHLRSAPPLRRAARREQGPPSSASPLRRGMTMTAYPCLPPLLLTSCGSTDLCRCAASYGSGIEAI